NRKYNKICKVIVLYVLYVASINDNNYLLISKLGALYVNFQRPLEGKVKQVTIKRQGSRWFAIFSVERHVNETVDFPVQSTGIDVRSEEHTSELQSRFDLVCRLLLEKKKITINTQ